MKGYYTRYDTALDGRTAAITMAMPQQCTTRRPSSATASPPAGLAKKHFRRDTWVNGIPLVNTSIPDHKLPCRFAVREPIVARESIRTSSPILCNLKPGTLVTVNNVVRDDKRNIRVCFKLQGERACYCECCKLSV